MSAAVPSTPELTLDLARQVLAAQPFSVLLGAEIVTFGGGEAVLELDVRDELRQQNGFAHGGVLAYAADNAITFAGGSALGPAVLTGGMTIEYVRPARGGRLRSHAQVVHAGRRRATCRVDVYDVDPDGAATLCAVGQGVVSAVGGGSAPAG